MFHPSRECSISPFQIFSLSWSRNHSATPCLTRRTRTVVALTPVDVDRLVGGEQRDAVPGEFLFQFQRVERVPAGPFDVLADHGGEPGHGAAASASRSAMPPSRGMPGVGELPATRRRGCGAPGRVPPDSMSQ